MWLDDDDEDTQDIFCRLCKVMIREEEYLAHEKACRQLSISWEKEAAKGPVLQRSGNRVTRMNCKICCRTMTIQQFQNHRYTCTSPKSNCQFCNTQFYQFQIQDHEKECQMRPQNIESRENQLRILRQELNATTQMLAEIQLRSFLRNTVIPAMDRMGKGMRKKKIAQLPRIAFSGEREENCPICQQQIMQGQDVIQFECGNKHIGHYSQCCESALRYDARCPLCRYSAKDNLKPQPVASN